MDSHGITNNCLRRKRDTLYKRWTTGPPCAAGNASEIDASLSADPGVVSSIPARPILSWRLIMKYFLRSFSFLPLNHSRRAVVSYMRKYVHEVPANRLFKLAQEKTVVR